MRSHTIMVLNSDESPRQLFFVIFAAAMFMHAFSVSHSGVSIRFRSNGSLFNLARLRSESQCMTTLVHEFQYADDCALIADSEEALQDSIDSFGDAASSVGLTINCKKTEVMTLQKSAVRKPLSGNGTHIPSNTSVAPSQMTSDWTRNSIAKSNVQLLLSGDYGIDSCPHMSFPTRQRYVYAMLQSPQHYSSEQKRGRFIKDTLCDCEVSNNDIYKTSSESNIPTESPMIKSLKELACPILR